MEKAVSDLSITIEDGDLYGFIGKWNGKTNYIKSVSYYSRLWYRRYSLNGVSIKSAPTECKKLMAYVPDTPILDPYLTGLQYLNFMCDIYSVSEENDNRKYLLFQKTRNAWKVKWFDFFYSHGMKQKVSLIGAFIHEPNRLYWTSLLVALDPEASIQFALAAWIMCVWWFGIIFKPFRC